MALSSLSSRIGSSVLTRRRIPFVGAFCVLSLGFSSLSSSSYKPGCAQSLSFAPLLIRLPSPSRVFCFSLLFLVHPYEDWRLFIIGLSLAVRLLLLHRSKWRRAAKLCPALSSTSLFLTEKQVL